MNQQERFDRMRQAPGPTMERILERGHLERGRSFSQEALDELNDDMATWVGTRLLDRWDRTQEPPTRLRVVLTVEVS